MKSFQFKQFNVHQEKSSMKIGTDAVLLGAWADVSNAMQVLDIGTGTGIISLMLAQRNNNCQITALEISQNAFEECTENFKLSKWSKKLKAAKIDFNTFETKSKFDLIVSNPPFYNNSFQAKNKERNIARHTDSLNFEILISKTASLLSKQGKACFIIPYSEEVKFVSIAVRNQLYVNKILHVKGNETSPIKRSLLSFSFQKSKLETDILSIEISRHQYAEAYKKLVKEFYLKM